MSTGVLLAEHDVEIPPTVVDLPPGMAGPDSFIEIEGPPDLVVEVVSDSSVATELHRLRKLYFEAGVAEYWLVDARGDELQFDILVPGAGGYQAVPCGAEDWCRTSVLTADYRLTRRRGRNGCWQYRLNQRD